MALQISISDCRWTVRLLIDKSTQAQASFWKCFCTFLQDRLNPFPMPFCHTRTVSCHRILGQLPYDAKMARRIPKKRMLKKRTSGYPAHWQWSHLLSKALQGYLL